MEKKLSSKVKIVIGIFVVFLIVGTSFVAIKNMDKTYSSGGNCYCPNGYKLINGYCWGDKVVHVKYCKDEECAKCAAEGYKVEGNKCTKEDYDKRPCTPFHYTVTFNQAWGDPNGAEADRLPGHACSTANGRSAYQNCVNQAASVCGAWCTEPNHPGENCKNERTSGNFNYDTVTQGLNKNYSINVYCKVGSSKPIHKPEPQPEETYIDINGTKTWNDENDKDGIRPKSITIELYKDNTLLDTKTVTAIDNWKYSFTNLPEKENGKVIKYSIKEKQVDKYTSKIDGYNITNTYVPKPKETYININGTKTWNDQNDKDGIRPETVVIELYKNGTLIKTTKASKSNSWKYSFTNLPEKENGKVINYSVKEQKIANYTSKINGYNIINTHIPKNKLIDIVGTKTWNDENNKDGIRPKSITIELYKNGTLIDTKIVTADDDWKYSFKNLPAEENNKNIKYTIKEQSIEGYTTEINNYDIVNTHIPIENPQTGGGITALIIWIIAIGSLGYSLFYFQKVKAE